MEMPPSEVDIEKMKTLKGAFQNDSFQSILSFKT